MLALLYSATAQPLLAQNALIMKTLNVMLVRLAMLLRKILVFLMKIGWHINELVVTTYHNE